MTNLLTFTQADEAAKILLAARSSNVVLHIRFPAIGDNEYPYVVLADNRQVIVFIGDRERNIINDQRATYENALQFAIANELI